MLRPQALIVALCSIILTAGLRAAPATTSAPATQPSLKGTDYRRTGGFAGFNDRITSTPDGAVEISSRGRAAKGQLTPTSRDHLSPLLESP